MADWTNVADTQLDPDAPLTSELAYAWRDNPIAISEGAVGAPRILDAAFGTTATNAGRNWVLNRNALAVPPAVGTYVFATVTYGSPTLFALEVGDLVPSAATLSPSSAGSTAGGANMPGTWRCAGRVNDTRSSAPELNRTTLFLRVS